MASDRITTITRTSQGALPQAAAGYIVLWLHRHRRPRAWLARQLGVSEPQLSRMLTRERPCTITEAMCIASVLGVPLATLLQPRPLDLQALVSTGADTQPSAGTSRAPGASPPDGAHDNANAGAVAARLAQVAVAVPLAISAAV